MHITGQRVHQRRRVAGSTTTTTLWLEKLAPHAPTGQYRHNDTGEDNADAHLKRQVMGREVVVAITGRQARLRAVGADLLRRVRRPAEEARARQGDRRMTREAGTDDGRDDSPGASQGHAAAVEAQPALADYEKLNAHADGLGRRLARSPVRRSARLQGLIAEENGEAIGYALFYDTFSSFTHLPHAVARGSVRRARPARHGAPDARCSPRSRAWSRARLPAHRLARARLERARDPGSTGGSAPSTSSAMASQYADSTRRAWSLVDGA